MQQPKGDPANVLIVDDELRLRELLLNVVTELGFQATAARNAEEAYRAMQEETRHIVLLDLQMGLMSGMELLDRMHKRWPATQVIIITGFGDLESARKAMSLDVVDFITKPFHLSEIEVALDRARKRLATGWPVAFEAGVDTLPPARGSLAQIEREAIAAALERHGGNRTAAAAELGISRRKLHYWLRENE